MSTLICDLRPSAADLVDEYRSLRQAGEPVVLYWPQAAPTADMVVVADLESMRVALDDEQVVCLACGGGVPAWLPLDDCNRILLLSGAAANGPVALAPPEAALLAALFAAGAEAVELLSVRAAVDLAQSWHSGRRVGAQLVTNY